jgi:hypothetical protein
MWPVPGVAAVKERLVRMLAAGVKLEADQPSKLAPLPGVNVHATVAPYAIEVVDAVVPGVQPAHTPAG